jgi:hypothetical protein
VIPQAPVAGQRPTEPNSRRAAFRHLPHPCPAPGAAATALKLAIHVVATSRRCRSRQGHMPLQGAATGGPVSYGGDADGEASHATAHPSLREHVSLWPMRNRSSPIVTTKGSAIIAIRPAVMGNWEMNGLRQLPATT